MFYSYNREPDTKIELHLTAWGTFSFDTDEKVWAALLDYRAEDPLYIGCYLQYEESNPCGTNEFNMIIPVYFDDRAILEMTLPVPEEPIFLDDFYIIGEDYPF